MRRISELDAVRGLAALAIVVHHLWLPGYGFLATSVDLFFVLSGYLITTIILRQHERPGFLKVFYARRALRIWPIYYLALLGLVVVSVFIPGTSSFAAWPYYLTYTQRLPHYWFGAEPAFPDGFRHTWTLAIEEQFYIIWPLLLVRFGRRGVVPCALAMLVIAVIARVVGFEPWILLTRADGLALGGLLAWLLEKDERAGAGMESWMFLAIGLSALAYLSVAAVLPGLLTHSEWLGPALALSHFGPRMLVINLLYFGLVGCLVRQSGARLLAPLRLRWLSGLGQMSYGLYLYHYILLYFVFASGAWERLGVAWAGLATLVASLAVSALSWRYVERPLLALKDRIAYDTAPAPAGGIRNTAARITEVRGVMSDDLFVYATAAVIVTVALVGAFRKSFDPFEPHWLFLAGYFQVYVVQAISYRDYALRARGPDLVAAANFRALWALVWFLLVYCSGVGRWLARRLPRPPEGWSTTAVSVFSPLLIVWGLFCAGLLLRAGAQTDDQSAESVLFASFPVMMMVGAILILVTGRQREHRLGPVTTVALVTLFAYIVIWMFNGRRSPPLFGVLATVCAFYATKGKRPSKPVLALTAAAGILVVSLALGFRGNREYEHSLSGFMSFVADFRVDSVLKNLNVDTTEEESAPGMISRETEEYGGFLLMMDTVPEKSSYDYGLSYLRLISTYIPRIVWKDKPLFGREQWVAAWIAGSEFKRKADFTGPAISLLGATQLNGGATATLIVLAVLALLLRTGYEYFRAYETFPWVQAWWALTYYNSWLMIATDDPFVWFYYVYGHTVVPPMALFFVINRYASRRAPAIGQAVWNGAGARPAVPA